MRQSAIYPYPAVQYIPLSLQVLYHKEPILTEPFLLIGDEVLRSIEKLSDKFSLEFPSLTNNVGKMFILAGGLHFYKAKYRGYYTTINGTKHSSISLYQIPSTYFYKETVVFEVKDEQGKVLTSKTFRTEVKK